MGEQASEAHLLVELVGPLNDLEQRFAPTVVHTRGDVRLAMEGTRIAIVGSRSASAAGLDLADCIAARCASVGLTVVSGLAAGIDTAAHVGAMRRGGRTIAVLGTPLDQCFPAANRELQQEIGARHLLVSQFERGTRVQRGNFPRRNKLMVLLAHALLVVEASEQSGTRDQVWSAIRVGKPVLITRHLWERRDVAWVADAVKYGAEVVEGPDDVVDAVGELCGLTGRG